MELKHGDHREPLAAGMLFGQMTGRFILAGHLAEPASITA